MLDKIERNYSATLRERLSLVLKQFAIDLKMGGFPNAEDQLVWLLEMLAYFDNLVVLRQGETLTNTQLSQTGPDGRPNSHLHPLSSTCSKVENVNGASKR